jgi:hypothetical protein
MLLRAQLNGDGHKLNGDQRRNPPFASNSRVLLPSQNFTLSCFCVGRWHL